MRTPFRKENPVPLINVNRAEIEDLLPASVRQPEVNRFKPADADLETTEDGEVDEDLLFLESLASSVSTGEAAPARPSHFTKPQLGAPEHKQVPERLSSDESLRLFHDTRLAQDERDRPNVHVDNVEIDDLMEDLETLRAALRQRRAA